MYEVVKRDGQVVDFNIGKITAAIKKAFDATNTPYNSDVVDFLALKVSADFLPKIKDGKVAVEDIQDSVEAVLSRGGYENVAKAYILYRKQREKLRNMKSTYLDYKDTVNKYLHVEDWRVKENSTVTYSVGGLILSNSGAITANYWLSEVYDQEIADAHRNCDIHLHDLSMLTGYCAGWSLKQLIKEGLGIPGKINSSPASLPGHHAERMGRRAGLLLLRHLSGSLRQDRQPQLQGSQAVHPELRLRREHAVPLGHAGALLQHHPRLDRAGRPQGSARDRRR